MICFLGCLGDPKNAKEKFEKKFFHPEKLIFLKISCASWHPKMVTRNKPRHSKPKHPEQTLHPKQWHPEQTWHPSQWHPEKTRSQGTTCNATPVPNFTSVGTISVVSLTSFLNFFAVSSLLPWPATRQGNHTQGD